eukprot:TRINITY_DN37171_c0_g1_i1.p1 TRINITY_DN37171_c0_g1~~TRINITY_DN37171_c0_g1_i1.p1  ORF type:complete len:352 (-),score=55.25 TRINITY_DN37171_c0_g1_i1:252-1307(-)
MKPDLMEFVAAMDRMPPRLQELRCEAVQKQHEVQEEDAFAQSLEDELRFRIELDEARESHYLEELFRRDAKLASIRSELAGAQAHLDVAQQAAGTFPASCREDTDDKLIAIHLKTELAQVNELLGRREQELQASVADGERVAAALHAVLEDKDAANNLFREFVHDVGGLVPCSTMSIDSCDGGSNIIFRLARDDEEAEQAVQCHVESLSHRSHTNDSNDFVGSELAMEAHQLRCRIADLPRQQRRRLAEQAVLFEELQASNLEAETLRSEQGRLLEVTSARSDANGLANSFTQPSQTSVSDQSQRRREAAADNSAELVSWAAMVQSNHPGENRCHPSRLTSIPLGSRSCFS